MTRSQEIIEASSQVTLDDYNHDAQWTFTDGESPLEWYDAQVRAINHFGHIFCINPFYNNMRDSFYGWEFESTDEMLARLTGSWGHYKDMTVRTVVYLKLNCDIEFPNKWGKQFHPIG